MRETERNQNPAITGVTFDGANWPADEVKNVGFCNADDFLYGPCPADEKHQSAAVASPASFESGKDELGRDFTEQLVI